MSRWTHIVAAIDVDTFIASKTIKSDVEKLLEDAPEITGSEGPADVFVNVLHGYNVYASEDYQTRVVITVIGDLRDKTGKATEKEWIEFNKFIETQINGDGWWIRNCTCKIVDEYEKLLGNNMTDEEV